jgi:preprotein translocase subunit SecG
MIAFLKFLLILDAFVVIAAVLLQSGKGGGVAASFGGASSSADAFMGVRQAGNLLTKLSWWGGGVFLALAFVLQIASTRSRVPTSVLDQTFTPPAGATGPAVNPNAPAAPLQSAPPAGAVPVPAAPAPAPQP